MRVPFVIRRAVLADLDRILETENASFGAEAYDRKLFAYYLTRCPGLFLVAGSRGRIGGYMITFVNGAAGTRAELVSVAVDPALRLTGLASALMDSTLRRLRRRGVERLHLVVRAANHPAQAYYRKFGFRRLRLAPEYYEDGEDGVVMSRVV